jgi:hypothetical protein
MIIFEYLFWILFIGYCNFVAIRLMWLYEQVEGHLFWRKTNAAVYYGGAALLLLAILSVLIRNFHVFYLLILLAGEYVLVAGAAAKVSDRGIMANAFMARWPDILQARRTRSGREIVLVTNRAWQWMRLRVPAEKEATFRKMLAAKGITIVDEEIAKSGPDIDKDVPAAPGEEMKQQQTGEGVPAENRSVNPENLHPVG